MPRHQLQKREPTLTCSSLDSRRVSVSEPLHEASFVPTSRVSNFTPLTNSVTEQERRRRGCSRHGTVALVARRDRDLAEQLRRAATSVPSNISEGAQRTGKDRHHFYRVAAGSAAEVRTQLEVAWAWGYIDTAVIGTALALLDRVIAMLWKLTR
jgi:four helix bundle protein